MRFKSTPDVNLHNSKSFELRHIMLLSLLMISGFLVVGQLYIAIPLAPDVARRFDVSLERATLVGTAFGFAYALGFLVFGPFSDRYGHRRLILFGLTATAFATWLASKAPGFELLLGARAVQGFVAAAFPPAALALIAEAVPPPYRHLGVSLMSLAFLSAAPLAQFFTAETALGVSALMSRLAPIYLLAAAALTLTTGSGTTQTPRGNPVHGFSSSLFRDHGVIAAWGAAFTVLFGFVSFHVGAQTLNAGANVDPQHLRLIGLPPLLLTLAAAPLTRRYGASVTACLGLGVAALAFVFLMVDTVTATMAASFLLSVGTALAIPGLIAIVAGRAADANRGLALALYSFCLFAGASMAPPVTLQLAHVDDALLWMSPPVLLVAAAIGLAVTRKQ